ncbi:MAG: thiamine pyrophosphate-dependent enzyme [Candidatus Bathyarchaeota archaeon]|nr:thiamine pyrophosphate-dependent enzyme [Candidatus Bathyarchaeota archaeon]
MSKPVPLVKLDEKEYIQPANQSCQGCTGASVARIVAKVLKDKMVRQEVACCGPAFGNLDQPSIYGEVFEGAGAMSTGLAHAFKRMNREDAIVTTIVGDGGTTDIGFQGLSGAAERNENVLWVCYDNEAYMNTGGQRSSATTKYAETTTTPVGEFSRGKKERRKNVAAMVALHRVPYMATASIAYPEDFIGKLEYAKNLKGFRFIQISAPCPTGWRFEPQVAVKIAKEMVLSGMWPLYEVIDGEKFRITYKPKDLKPVKDVLKMQGRFRHITEDEIKDIQDDVTAYYNRLVSKDGKEFF